MGPRVDLVDARYSIDSSRNGRAGTRDALVIHRWSGALLSPVLLIAVWVSGKEGTEIRLE